MPSFGCYSTFPWEFGGADSTIEIEHQAMLDALAPGYDIAEGTAVWNETYAHAVAISSIWDINERVGNQPIPARMLEALTEWEEACDLRPGSRSLDNDRRAAVASALRGLSGNTPSDIDAACRAIWGTNFVDLVVPEAADVTVYMPGGPSIPVGTCAPGPPGFEFSSNRLRIGIRVSKDGLSTQGFLDKRAITITRLHAMFPSWETYVVGVGDGFICNQGLCGQTFL